jgi:1-deoxy-D-xylulose-5-phosphate reductoisomerase
MAQLGMPDMKLPIQYALTYPERCDGPSERLDMGAVGALEFYAPDPERFRALSLGFEAARTGGTYGATLSGANEVAVNAFLKRKIKFTGIVPLIEKVIGAHSFRADPSLAEIFEADRWARAEAERCLS